MASEIALLTDDDLRTKLRSFNLRDGPITKTTRKLFEAKLARAMGLNNQVEKLSETQEQEVENVSEEQVEQQTANVSDLIDKSSTVSNSPNTREVGDLKLDSVNRKISAFYGVCFIQTVDNESENENRITVFTDRTEALHCVKKNSGARFRAFSTRNEAEAFALAKTHAPSRQSSQELTPSPIEPSSEYKGPKRGEITNFRRLIEKGEVDNFAKVIYGNPRYLISSGDTPVIIQEGCHYNSMHVAAKAGHKDICKLIVSTLNDDEFWKLMYPTKEKIAINCQLINRRKAFLLDLYLNTPDKGGCETPLHFACKFGKADVVEYLLSLSGTEITMRNKEGKTAEQVICARVPNGDEKLHSKIQRMFHKPESVCVPILRSDDNCSSPKIGTPWSSRLHENNEDVVDAGDSGHPRYKVCAYAGPMSPQEAEKFYHSLRSPRATPEKQAKFRNIKRSDSEKGLERVARKLAKSQNVPWCEYWKFLECFADFSTSEGLEKLEKYFKDRNEIYRSSVENVAAFKTPVSSKCLSFGSLRGHLSGDDVFDGSESTPSSKTDHVREINSTPFSRTRNANIKNFRNRLNLDESLESEENAQLNPNVEVMDLDVNRGNTNAQRNYERDIITEQDINICEEQLINGKSCGSAIKGESPDSVDTNALSPNYSKGSLDISNCSEDSLSGLIPEFQLLSFDEISKSGKGNNCADVKNSPTEDRDKREIVSTRKMEDISLFIEGIQPSKVDLDVFRTIKTTTIDPVVYPFISRWQRMVRSFTKATREAWPSPGSPRYYKTRRNIPKTWSC